jgi:hypothetical protein
MAVPGLDPGISPGHLDYVKRPAIRIGITGTRPVMTNEESRGITSRVLVSAAFSPYVLLFRI